MAQRGEDPGGELGGAAAVRQLEDRVQIGSAVGGELSSERKLEAGRSQPANAPVAQAL